MCESMVNIQSATAENRRGKNKERKKKPQKEETIGRRAAIIKVRNRIQLLKWSGIIYLLIL